MDTMTRDDDRGIQHGPDGLNDPIGHGRIGATAALALALLTLTVAITGAHAASAVVVVDPVPEPLPVVTWGVSDGPDIVGIHRYKGVIKSPCSDAQQRACESAAYMDAAARGHYLVVRSVTCEAGPELSYGPMTYCDWQTFDPETGAARPSIPPPVTR